MHNKYNQRKDFLQKVKIGSVIAFKQDDRIVSGKVIELRPTQFVVRTKSCCIYFVDHKNFVWLKLGTHWPLGIYNALYYKAPKT